MSKKKKKTENLEDSQNQEETFDVVIEPDEHPVSEDTDTDTCADTDTDTDARAEEQDGVYTVYVVAPGHRISVRGGVKRAGQVISASMFSQGEGIMQKLLETGGIVKQ